LKNLPEVANGPALAQGENRDILGGIVGRRKEGKALNVVPVKMGEGDDNLLLPMAHGHQILAEIPDPGARVKNGNRLRVGYSHAHTGAVGAKFLKAGITHGSGTARAIEFEFHSSSKHIGRLLVDTCGAPRGPLATSPGVCPRQWDERPRRSAYS